MGEPFIIKNHLAIAVIAGLQMIVPALIAVALLYMILNLYHIQVDQSYNSMAALVALLALLLPRPPRTLQNQLASNSIPIAMTSVSLCPRKRWPRCSSSLRTRRKL